MKKSAIRLLSLILAVIPLSAMSQSNIKSAFDAIIDCPNAKISPSHFLQKDPETGIKSGQDDIYRFTIPKNRIDLIKKAQRAFDKDNHKAYAVKSGKNEGSNSQILLHTEDNNYSGISIDVPGSEYIYALFLPSKQEDPDGNYRYAYGMNFKEENGEIVGKIFINYATTLKYRESLQQNQFQWRNGTRTTTHPNGVIVIESTDNESVGDTWFEQVMKCVNGMSDASHKTRLALATKAFKIITDVKKYPEVTEQDKIALRQIFKAMRLDTKRYSDPTLNALIHECELAIH